MTSAHSTVNSQSETVQHKPNRLLRFALYLLIPIILLCLGAAYLWFFEKTGHSTPKVPPRAVAATENPINDAIQRGIEYLRIHQEKDGNFSKGILDPKPAFTALVVDALVRSGRLHASADKEMIDRAAQAIVSRQQKDGAIGTPSIGLTAYSTAVSIMALKGMNDPKYNETIERARDFLLRIQRPVVEGDPLSGGVGYTAGGRVDGSNTAMWVEALKEVGMPEDSEAFKNAALFFQRLQNNPETNDLHAPDTELDNDGGMFYRPGESKPTDGVSANGKRILRSYGLMSYAGLKSFIYMNVDKSDPRVQSSWRWVQNNYTLNENRNVGADGLYYYYMTMAKALNAYGVRYIETDEGEKRDWANELIERLLALQQADGCWKNTDSSRWMENDAVMVTAFAIRTLAICQDFLARHPD